ncbi:hypothetical protein M4D79_20640 [Mycolicibacterium novocastrense]|nr:hypothetical protein M4D79_20640 [Mycolicibacterium novocastrense]
MKVSVSGGAQIKGQDKRSDSDAPIQQVEAANDDEEKPPVSQDEEKPPVPQEDASTPPVTQPPSPRN